MQVKCNSCGANQEINSDSNCSFCENQIQLEVGAELYKSSSSGEIGNLMAMADTAAEAGNWEEAIIYYNKVLEKDLTISGAWLGKGVGIVNTSTTANLKVKEAISYWKNAIKNAPDQTSMSRRVALEINSTVVSFYPIIESNYLKFITVENSFLDFASKFFLLESALDYASDLYPESLTIAENGLNLCKRMDPVELYLKRPAKVDEKEKIAFSALASLKKMETILKLEEKYLEKIGKIDPEKLLRINEIEKDKAEEKKHNEKETGKSLFAAVSLVVIWSIIAGVGDFSGGAWFWGGVIFFFLGFFVHGVFFQKKYESQKKND